MAVRFELRHLTATLVFDLEDAYARRRGTRGLHPRPIGPVDYRLLGRVVGGVRQDFDHPLPLVIRRNPSGYDLCFGQVELPGHTCRRVPEGTYALRITSPYAFYQPIEQEDIVLPRPATAYAFDLEPGYAYPFPTETLPGGRGPTLLRGTWLGRDGRGIAGVAVQVVGNTRVCVTDSTGEWVLVFPDDQPTGDITVRFEAPGGTAETVPDVLVVGGRAASLRQTALRGWTMTAAGAPIGGASVAVSGQPASVTSRLDGSWSYYFPLPQSPPTVVSVTASLPDGRTQTCPTVQVHPRSTVLVPSFPF